MHPRVLALACLAAGLLLATADPARAGAVKSWGPVDGIGAVPLFNGSAVLDIRAAAFVPRATHAVSEISLLAGASEWLEIGASVTAGFQGAASLVPGLVAVDIYPWAKAALPLSTDTLKTGLILGGALSGFQSTTDPTPGATALVDLALGPLLANLNLGFARRLNAGQNLASANLNFTIPLDGLTLYEEQFALYPFEQFTTAGVRATAVLPMGERLTVDGSLAALYTNAPGQAAWVLSPAIGFSTGF